MTFDRTVKTFTLDDMNGLNDKSAITFGPEDRGFVYAVARRIVGSAEDAEDVTQDALLLAYRHRDQFRGESKYRTWLYRIASTTALGHLRRRKRSRELLATTDEPLGAKLADTERTPEARLADAETENLVQRAIETLAPKYREVITRRATSSEAEIAGQLGISVANVKIRAHRARRQLRDQLACVR